MKQTVINVGKKSADLLFQPFEFRRGEKFVQGDIQPVAQLLDGCYRDTVIVPAGDVADGRRRDAVEICQLVWSNISLAAKGINTCQDSFTDIYDRSHPNSFEMISV